MNPEDFVFQSIKREAMKGGATEMIAEKFANLGRSDYKRNRFKKATKMVEDMIDKAIKETKKAQESVI